jgi:hypothetical protein
VATTVSAGVRRVGGQQARRQRGAEAGVAGADVVEGPPQQVGPAQHLDADGQVQRQALARGGLVDVAARQVEQVAGAQEQLLRRRAQLVAPVGGPLLGEGEVAALAVEAPVLLALDLEDEDLVSVVMGVEALRASAGRQVEVRVDGAVEEALQPAAQGRHRRPAQLHRRQDEGLAAGEGPLHRLHVGI